MDYVANIFLMLPLDLEPAPLTSEEILNPFLASLLRFNKKLALACNLADFVF